MRSFLCFLLLSAIAYAYTCLPDYHLTGVDRNSKYYCYKVYQTYYSRQQAVARCAQDGATLATITSDDENQMYVTAGQVPGSLYFGLSCIDNDHCAFDDGTPFNIKSYNNFVGGGPNGNQGQCVTLQTHGSDAGFWINTPCTTLGSFVCSYNPNSITSRQSGCNKLEPQILQGASDVIRITSPYYPGDYYDQYETCSYFVKTIFEINRLNITFTAFDLDENDSVRIYDGGYASHAKFQREYKGQKDTPFSVVTLSSEAMITFTSWGNRQNGFSAVISDYL